MAKSLKLVGDTPLHEAAERYPVDAYRVFMKAHHTSDTDESLVCDASLFQAQTSRCLRPCTIRHLRPVLASQVCLILDAHRGALL